MGIAYLNDARKRLTVTVWDGAVSASEWHDQVETLVASNDLLSCDLFLGDIRCADDVSSIGDDDIIAVARRFALAAPRGAKIAIVATNLFSGAQTFEAQAMIAGVRTAVFIDVAPACEWLGVDLNAAEISIDLLRRRIRSTQ
jgi:hypothetical protein